MISRVTFSSCRILIIWKLNFGVYRNISDVLSYYHLEFPYINNLGTEMCGPREQIYDVLLSYLYKLLNDHNLDTRTFDPCTQFSDALQGDNFELLHNHTLDNGWKKKTYYY